MAKRYNTLLILIILLIGLFFISTIREGHNWGGDFAQYIHHAKNIAEGKDYSSIGYIYDEFNPTSNHIPKTYPPIFPIILSPFYMIFGLNLYIMKVVVVIFFMLSLYLIYLIAEKYLQIQYSIPLIITIGIHPYLWKFKENILSDIPFMFILYLSFYIIERLVSSTNLHEHSKSNAIILGFIFYAAYGTRIVGLALVLSFTIFYLIKFKKVSMFLVTTLSIFTLLFLIQVISLPGDKSYFQFLISKEWDYLQNIIDYIKVHSHLFENGYSAIFRRVLFLLFGTVSLFGFISKIKTNFSILEIFYILYSFVVIAWPTSPNMRFLVPVIPLFFFYTFFGIREITHRLLHRRKIIFQSLMAVSIIIIYILRYSSFEYHTDLLGVSSKESTELFDFIKRNTTESDIFLFRKPRVLSLFTNRNTSYSSFSRSDSEFWRYVKHINATHIILGPIKSKNIEGIVRRHERYLKLSFTNESFDIFKILPYPDSILK